MTRSLSIGIICHPTYGGSGVVASELAISLAERRHQVHLFSHRVPPRLAQCPGPVQVHVSQGLPYPLFESTPHDLAIISSIINVHRDEGLDVLHAHYALPHALSAVSARTAAESMAERPAPRMVTTLHGTDITIVGRDPSYAPLTQFLISASDAATAVSKSLAQDTMNHFCTQAMDGCTIEVIPNFVDLKRSRPGPQKAQGKNGPFQAVHVSNFRGVKRVPWLIEAFAKASEGLDAKLTLVGDGPEQGACLRKVEELGLGGRVAFLGMRDALPELLAPADIFLLTSREESFGLSALEAMACGVPVLATGAGGVPELIQEGVNGWLCSVDDQEGFAKSLRAKIVGRNKLAGVGRTARAHVEENYSLERVVGLYEDLYRRLLAEAKSPAPLPSR